MSKYNPSEILERDIPDSELYEYAEESEFWYRIQFILVNGYIKTSRITAPNFESAYRFAQSQLNRRDDIDRILSITEVER